MYEGRLIMEYQRQRTGTVRGWFSVQVTSNVNSALRGWFNVQMTSNVNKIPLIARFVYLSVAR